MSEQTASDVKMPDPAQLTMEWARIAERSQTVLAEFLARQSSEGANPDPLNISGAFAELMQQIMADPARLVQAQIALWQDYLKLWQATTERMLGQPAKPVIEPAKGDRRFADASWNENLVFDYIKQSYLLSARWLQHTVQQTEGLDAKTARKVDFYTRQFVDAMAPSNFVLTNPQVLKATLESHGENLIRGLQNLLDDLERGKGRLAIKMTNPDAFSVGGNVAVTPGKVIFQNDLLQLLQYAPTTEQVYRRPLLIVPPWINKFYILDLKPENSFIKWAVDQGYTVFVISWVNPDERLAGKTFEDYMLEGPLAAMDAIARQTGEREVSAIGYCIGGTLMASTLAYMAAIGDDRVKACTFFTAQVDFSEAGQLSVFIDEEQLNLLDDMMAKRGYLDAAEMSMTFNMLRANDLIWSFVVNNYLLGKDPFPFDLLFWNSDSTRLPAAMHSFYLRRMYQENQLVKPGAITLANVPIDLTRITIPVYLQAGREDHIAPYRSVYKATQHFRGPVRFMLAGSGHIAGVVNPPRAKKYQHWLNETGVNPPTPEEWLEGAVEHPGSWWHDWDKWLSALSGEKVPARDPSKGGLQPIEDAPGSYVKVRAN